MFINLRPLLPISVRRCDTLILRDHMFISNVSLKDQDYVVNDTVELSCNRGYELLPNLAVVRCTETGAWNSTLPHCTGNQCLVNTSIVIYLL